ncbi:MAG: hypothetical protein H6624_16045 [Bdellovibrionaceae bacterium]|nr:hypothetical protein [Bdellovibrionales bacterium]MCB9085860.1 hypothetical protein [Pseudobdellovibrionaceae bacterium]
MEKAHAENPKPQQDVDTEMLNNLEMLLDMDMFEEEDDMSMVEEMEEGEMNDESA